MTHHSFSEEEINKFRSETKGSSKRIHFNNAGSSLPPDSVVETVVAYLQEEAEYGGYETENKYAREIEQAYASIAKLINADKSEVAIVENASMAWGLAFNGITFSAGDEIITSELEYVSNVIGFINVHKTQGVEIKIIPHDEDGNFSANKIEQAITKRTKLIAITHVGSSAGGVMPVAEIGKIARKHGILYLVDACQSIGQIPINVKEIGCDMLSVTGRKYLRGPRGTGFLFVKREIQDQLKLILFDGFTAPVLSEADYSPRNDGRRFELFEKNRALILGLGKAAEYALAAGPHRIWNRIQQLSSKMRQQLKSIEGVTVHEKGENVSGIVTFSVRGFESAEIKNKLSEKQINVWVAGASSTIYYMNKNKLASVVRASLHYYNTEEEVAKMCGEVRRIAGS